ncbi:MAG: hypothetical protein M1827_005778 [Pycnora praestabilis]|nr:MAG: hypothetical protein M1827_005778 [Pycnora praestabilis]
MPAKKHGSTGVAPRYDLPYFSGDPLDPVKYPGDSVQALAGSSSFPASVPTRRKHTPNLSGSEQSSVSSSDDYDGLDFPISTGPLKRHLSPSAQRRDYKRVRVTGGRPALPKKVVADHDSDDALIVKMKQERFTDKQVAEHLKKERRVKFDSKTISSRYVRLKRVLAARTDELLDEGLTDWHEGEDKLLLKAKEQADDYIVTLLGKVEAKRWQKVAQLLKDLKPSTNYSQNACKNRYQALEDGTASIPPELSDHPVQRAAEKATRLVTAVRQDPATNDGFAVAHRPTTRGDRRVSRAIYTQDDEEYWEDESNEERRPIIKDLPAKLRKTQTSVSLKKTSSISRPAMPINSRVSKTSQGKVTKKPTLHKFATTKSLTKIDNAGYTRAIASTTKNGNLTGLNEKKTATYPSSDEGSTTESEDWPAMFGKQGVLQNATNLPSIGKPKQVTSTTTTKPSKATKSATQKSLSKKSDIVAAFPNGTQTAGTGVTVSALGEPAKPMTVVQMKAELKKRGLSRQGLRHECETRLAASTANGLLLPLAEPAPDKKGWRSASRHGLATVAWQARNVGKIDRATGEVVMAPYSLRRTNLPSVGTATAVAHGEAVAVEATPSITGEKTATKNTTMKATRVLRPKETACDACHDAEKICIHTPRVWPVTSSIPFDVPIATLLEHNRRASMDTRTSAPFDSRAAGTTRVIVPYKGGRKNMSAAKYDAEKVKEADKVGKGGDPKNEGEDTDGTGRYKDEEEI